MAYTIYETECSFVHLIFVVLLHKFNNTYRTFGKSPPPCTCDLSLSAISSYLHSLSNKWYCS